MNKPVDELLKDFLENIAKEFLDEFLKNSFAPENYPIMNSNTNRLRNSSRNPGEILGCIPVKDDEWISEISEGIPL